MWIIKHIPLKAESFSSLSRIFRSDVHQERINWLSSGETSLAQWSPSRPSVIPVFSKSVLGWARREISISGGRTDGINLFMLGPITIAISPIAQQALLQTDIYSKLNFYFYFLMCTKPGFKFSAKTGISWSTCGWTNLKHAFVKSPSKAKADWRTWKFISVNQKYTLKAVNSTSGNMSAIHCAINCNKLEFSTKGSIIFPKPSAILD